MLDVCTQKAGKGGAFLGGGMRVGEPCTYTYTPFKTSFGGVFGDWRVVSSSFRNLPLKALVKFPSNCVYTPVGWIYWFLWAIALISLASRALKRHQRCATKQKTSFTAGKNARGQSGQATHNKNRKYLFFSGSGPPKTWNSSDFLVIFTQRFLIGRLHPHRILIFSISLPESALAINASQTRSSGVAFFLLFLWLFPALFTASQILQPPTSSKRTQVK